MKRLSGFSFEDWRRRYIRWMAEQECRAIDLFKRYDCDGDGSRPLPHFGGRQTAANCKYLIMRSKLPLGVLLVVKRPRLLASLGPFRRWRILCFSDVDVELLFHFQLGSSNCQSAVW
ncbi:Microtubule-actin cross-linking factor [Trichinella spiralis]|uniref:Microtubule-actin cross-linking factor n=1 Tax=Trichinella spiralis TaxID=6334 RepID=A0ABR3K5J7_TRISP